jgi:hypothetical protein
MISKIPYDPPPDLPEVRASRNFDPPPPPAPVSVSVRERLADLRKKWFGR